MTFVVSHTVSGNGGVYDATVRIFGQFGVGAMIIPRRRPAPALQLTRPRRAASSYPSAWNHARSQHQRIPRLRAASRVAPLPPR